MKRVTVMGGVVVSIKLLNGASDYESGRGIGGGRGQQGYGGFKGNGAGNGYGGSPCTTDGRGFAHGETAGYANGEGMGGGRAGYQDRDDGDVNMCEGRGEGDGAGWAP